MKTLPGPEPTGPSKLAASDDEAPRARRRWLRTTGLAVAALVMLPAAVLAWQGWDRGYGGWRRYPPRFPDRMHASERLFTFARGMYRSVRREYLGQGWVTDYPDADMNFMNRFEEFTSAEVSREAGGRPAHVVLLLDDEALFDFPFLFMSDVGTIGLGEPEVENLRAYLLKGGFLWVDDFWGSRAWDHWTREIDKVLPRSQYPIVDIPRSHPLFRVFYMVEGVPQIPSIQFWRRAGRWTTSEQGADSAEVHFRGIFDDNGRLLVLMSHNTDIADGWEREGEEYEYFDTFSADAYALGINVVLHGMTH